MKIAISASGPGLDAEVDPRFGRCQYFIIADPETLEFEAMDNASAMASGGAGIAAAQSVVGKSVQAVLIGNCGPNAVVGKSVQAVLIGNCGPNAHQVLSAAGVQVITGVSGAVKQAIEGYQSGKLSASDQPNVPDHFGSGGATGGGMGRGTGMGRGMGGGMGRGMGRSVTPPAAPPPQPQTLEQELDTLKAQSQAMAQQLSETQRRIDELTKKREQ